MELWSWVLSIVGLVGIWLAGSRHWAGWPILLTSEVLWVVYAFQTAQLGFVMGSIAWSAVYTRNIVEWRREKRATAALHRALAEPTRKREAEDVREALHDLED